MINKYGEEFTPILCVDFDGVLRGCIGGRHGRTDTPDPPNPGVLEWLLAAQKHWDVQIYSARSSAPGGIDAMKEWLIRYGLEIWDSQRTAEFMDRLKFPTQKPPAFLMIDDRAICFQGDFGGLDPEELLKFKPWYRCGREPIGLESP
jgi:hypothetical protein